MSKQKGQLMLVRIMVGAAYQPLCGLRSKTLTINNAEVDVTTADCENPASALWTEVLSGIKRVSVAGSGLSRGGAAEERVRELSMAVNAIEQFQIVVPNFGTFTGSFLLGTFELGGEQEAGLAFNIALASSGAVTFAPET